MKNRIIVSLLWIAATFLLLSWVLYAVNDYQSLMLAAVTGQPGTPPTVERAKKLEAKIREAKSMDEVRALTDQIGEDFAKYWNVDSASIALGAIVRRVWILWGVSASIPLLFAWWAPASDSWRRFQSARSSDGSPIIQGSKQ